MKLSLRKANFLLRLYALFKVPLIGYCRPKIIQLDDQEIKILIPLKRRQKNHLNSMYFGALGIGADVTGALFALVKGREQKLSPSLAFKGVNAEFLFRPEADVVFTCKDGELIDQMLSQTRASGERVNHEIEVLATCPSLHADKVMARFNLELSLKA